MSETGSGGWRPKLAILGADGFIGSHATRLAVESGHSVIALCAKEPWRLRDIEPSVELVPIPGGHWWTADFADRLAGFLAGVEALLLLSYTPPPDREIDAWSRHEREVNVAGARRIIDLSAGMGVRVVFTSSADVYGTRPGEGVSERARLDPATPYSEGKREVEEIVNGLAESGDACSLRLSTVYGQGENGPRAIPSFIRAYLAERPPQIHGTGEDVRDYVHVEDVATAHLRAATADREVLRASGGPFNVGSGVGRSTNDILDAVAAAVGVEPAVEYVESPRKPSHLVLDPSRAIEQLGMDFARDFEAEVGTEAAWLRRHLAEER